MTPKAKLLTEIESEKDLLPAFDDINRTYAFLVDGDMPVTAGYVLHATKQAAIKKMSLEEHQLILFARLNGKGKEIDALCEAVANRMNNMPREEASRYFQQV